MTQFLFSSVRQFTLFLCVVVFSIVKSFGQSAAPFAMNLHLWYSAADYSTTTYPYTFHSGSTVYATLPNKVATGAVDDAVQLQNPSPVNYSPTYNATGINGKPALVFDGVNNFMEILPFVYPDNLFNSASGGYAAKSIFLVFNASDIDAAGTDYSTAKVLFDQGGTANGINVYINGGNLYFHVYSGDSKESFVNIPIVANQTYQCSMVFNGAAGLLEIYVNGRFVKSISDPTMNLLDANMDYNAIGSAYGDTRFPIGHKLGDGFPGVSYPFAGMISEFLYYNRVLSRTEREQTENYLLNTYSITAPVGRCLTCIDLLKDQSLVWYKSDEDLTSTTWSDEADNGLNATTIGTAATVSTGVINGKPAISFASSTRGFQLPSTNLLNAAGTSYAQRSWYFVMKPDADVSSTQVIYKEGNTDEGINIYIAGNNLYCVMYAAGGTVQSSVSKGITGGIPIFVSVVVKGGQTLTMLVDGEPISTSLAFNLDHSISTSMGNSISLGSSDVNGAYYLSTASTAINLYKGYIAEVAIFDRAYNTIEEDIVYQNLALKYNINIPTAYNKYLWGSTFGSNLGGVGNINVTEYNRTSCSGIFTFAEDDQTDGLLVLLAENNATLSDYWKGFNSNTEDAPLNVFRSKHAWRADVWNANVVATTAKEISYSIKQTDFPFTPDPALKQQAVLIVDHDGDFRNGAKVYVLDLAAGVYTADQIPTSDGDFISIGVLNNYEFALVGSPTYTHDIDVFGMADRGYTTNTLTSSAIVLDYPSSLQIGDYILLADDAGDLSFSNASNVPSPAFMTALARTWKVNKFKEVGTVGLEFDPSLLTTPATLASGDDYILLIDHTGTGTFTSASIEALVFHYGKYRVFNENFSLKDGDVFTIALSHRPAPTKLKNTAFLFKENLGQITSAVSTLTTLVGEDILAYPIATPCAQQTTKATLFFTFNTGDDYLFGTTAFSAEVVLKILSRTVATGDPSTLIKECTLTVNKDNPEQLYAVDLTTYYNSYPYKEITVEVESFTPPSPSSAMNTTIQQSLVLKAEIVQEQTVTVTTTPGTLIKNQAATFVSTNKACQFTWDIEYCQPASYEFQLLRLFNTETYGTTYPLDVTNKNMYDADLDWSKAMDLETTEQSITLTLAEGTGFYAWRVRPIGTFFDGGIANSFNWGKWSSADISRLTANTVTILSDDPLTDFKGSVLYYDQFDEDKNFIYNRGFTEEGKIHEGISYANGLQQGVQTQSRLVSNGDKGQVVISETVQDFSGRSVIETMPTPDETVDGLGAANNLLGYRTNHLNDNNISDSDTGFNAFDFDTDADNSITNITNPLINGMTNLYYNDLNTDAQIPNAEYYPYSRVLHDNDGLNRPKEQGGVGATHKIGGKTVKIMYASATEAELIRVFGDEAPSSKTVQKTITTDQNGISSVTYTDLAGKVIATSLVPGDGATTSNLLPIASQSYKIVEPLNNNIPIGTIGEEASKPFVFTQSTDVAVSILLTPSLISSHCGNYCATCSYIATIQVTDVSDPTNTLTNQTQTINITGGEITCPSDTTIHQVVGATPTPTNITITLPAGKYVIKKTITVDQTAAATYASSITTQINTQIQNFVTAQITPYITAQDIKGLNDNLQKYLTGESVESTGLSFSVQRGDPTLTPYNPVTNNQLVDGDKLTISSTCCSLTLPIMFPDIDPCKQYIAIGTPDYTGFANELVKRFKTAYNIPLTTDLSINYSDYGTYNDVDLTGLFTNMLQATDDLGSPLYNCDKIWECWNAQIMKAGLPASGTLNSDGKVAVSHDVIGGDIPDGMPSWADPTKINDATSDSDNPVEQFLICTGLHLKGFLPSKTSTLRQHAFELFFYNRDEITAGQEICENFFCKHQPGDPAESVCTPLTCPKELHANAAAPYNNTLWFKNTSGVYTDLTETEYSQLSECIKAQQNETADVTVPTTDDITAQFITQKTTIEGQCNSACDSKRDDFMYKLKKLFDADGDGIYRDANGMTVSPEDLCCTADRLVDYCKDQCNLSLLRTKCTDPSEVRIVSMGTEEEMNNVLSIIYGSFDLEDASSSEEPCSTSYRKAESCYNAVGIYHLSSSEDAADEAHASDPYPANYDLTYNTSDFESGRYTSTGTTAMSSPANYASCSTDGDRGITTNVTVSAWVRMSDHTGSGDKIIVQKMDPVGTSSRKGFRLYTKDQYVYFEVADNGTIRNSGASIYPLQTTKPGSVNLITDDLLIPDQEWHFVTGVCRDTIVEVWIDGEYQNGSQLSSGTITSIASAEPLRIGSISAYGESFEGPIDEVYIYSCAMGKGAILEQYTSTKWSNVIYTPGPSVSLDCAPGPNVAPDRIWDIGAGLVEEGQSYVSVGQIKMADGRIWDYGWRYQAEDLPNYSIDQIVIIDQNKQVKEITGLIGDYGRIIKVIPSTDGNYIVAGLTYNSSDNTNNGLYLFKINGNGDIIWQNYYANRGTISFPWFADLIEVGDFIFLTHQLNPNGGHNPKNILVQRYNASDGTANGSNIFLGDTEFVDANKIILKSYGGNLFVGSCKYDGSPNNWDMYLVKINISSWTVTWEKTYGGSGDDRLTDFHILNNGNNICLLAGTNSPDLPGKVNLDPSVLAYDQYIVNVNTSDGISAGAINWQKVLGKVNYTRNFSTSILVNDVIIVSGGYTGNGNYLNFLSTAYPGFGENGQILFISNTGVENDFAYKIDGTNKSYISSVTPVEDGYLLYAIEYEGTNMYDLPSVSRELVIKVDQSLNTLWERAIVTNDVNFGAAQLHASYINEMENHTLITGYSSYATDDITTDRKSINGGVSDAWFLNLGYPTTCAGRPICIKWNRAADVPVHNPEPTEPTAVGIMVKTLTDAISTQMDNCKVTNLTAILDEYKARCNGNIIETATVSYSVISGQYTLYYYDRAGNLVKTVPPEGVDFLTVFDPTSGDPIPSVLARQVHPQHRLLTTYKYNSIGQLIEQQSPDGGIARAVTKFVYNKQGMLRFSQNTKQVADQTYSYTKYDELGRVVEVGKASELTSATFATLNDPVLGAAYLDGTTAFGHTSFPSTGTSEETYSVYSAPAAELNYLGAGQRYLQNRVGYTFSTSLNGEKSVTAYSYDSHGNVEWLVQDVPGFARNTVGYEYDLISNKVTKAKFNEERTDQFFHRYTYDEDNRIVSTLTSRDNYLWDNDARYSYYKHGPLRRHEIGEDKIQGMDYTYTIHGWLKGVNASSASASDDPGLDDQTANAYTKDEYGFVLGYYANDFNRTGSILANTSTYAVNSTKPLYNGNITSWVSRIDKEASSSTTVNSTTLNIAGQTFEYDYLNRIRNSKFNTFSSGAFTLASASEFNTSYTYDGNGNLMSLTRNASGSTPALDNLTYNYNLDVNGNLMNNQLRSVNDAVTTTGGEDIKNQTTMDNYTYDGIGNLITDVSEGMQISWNVYGKVNEVKRITPTSNTKSELRFVYDASGNRIAKEVNSVPYTTGGVAQRLPENLITTYYVRDASENVMGIYERDNVPLTGKPDYYTATYKLKEMPIYGSSRIGEFNQHDVDFVIGTKIFYKDDVDKVQLDFNFADKKTEYTNWITSSAGVDQFTISSTAYSVPKVNLHSITGSSSALTGDAISNIQAFAGAQASDVSVAESDNGQVLFYTSTFKEYWGKSNVLLLFDADGNLMPNSGAINASTSSRSVIVRVPGNAQQYYLITRGTDKKLYSHTIDLTLKGNGTTSVPKGDIVTKNAVMDNNTYGGNLVALENYATGSSYVYATRYQAPTDNTKLGNLSIVLFEINAQGPTTIKKPEVQCSNVTSWKDVGESEMQFSPDNKKFLLYNHLKNKGWFGLQRSEVIVYNVAANYRLTSNYVVDSVHVVAGITMPGQSAEFSTDSRFVYYGSDRLTLTGSPVTGKSLSRYDIRNKNNALVFQGHNGDLRRGLTTKIYLNDTLTQALPAYYEDNTGVSIQTLNAISFTTPLATGFDLTGVLPLQNNKIYGDASQNTVYSRIINKKLYELNDHLGNVTVIVSDVKNASWSGGIVSNTADVETYNNYYAFGMIMPGRILNSGDYRYGYNGQEKDDEISGSGNSYTAEFWQYDSRLGRRWNLDPKPVTGISPYAVFLNSPIWLNDPNGDCPPGVPCFDPVENPRISNDNGGSDNNRFLNDDIGRGRRGERPHYGVDILAEKGTRLRNMVAGEVVEVTNNFKPGQYAKDSYGNTITIKSELPDGSSVYIKYAHLDYVYFEVGDKLQRGKILGGTGNTGNAANIEEDNYHVHIEASTDGVFYGGNNRVDPEIYMKTQFNSNGNPIPEQENNSHASQNPIYTTGSGTNIYASESCNCTDGNPTEK